ncbi:N-acetylglucosamine-1-phosphotransferase subunits alpha/beta-like isoform X2 [Mya arenaria]|uniref:N-acetylglucosamine-1-phosphotransferase subunits alpha/beta-like isoform X2 n=1 Tax=Mya arenaria TaxID=6604 RepID=UPI0022E23D24|nr:N-acetylglucosamine-1-phosphotransferase subunits alpha/beta-like isoform X2 [Mya arenaria]
MESSNWRKLIQKQIYDILSHRYGLFVIVIGLILIVTSAFHFGESVVEWSTEKYASVFNSFSDNLAGKSYRERLCLPVPIDVVYTWVNGTDSLLIRRLQRVKLDMQDQLNSSREIKCVFSNCVRNNMVVLSPAVEDTITLTLLGVMTPGFQKAKNMFKVTSPIDLKNYTVVVFSDTGQASALVNSTLVIRGQNASIIQGHVTSDSKLQNVIELRDQILMSGFPHTLSTEELMQKLPQKHQDRIEKMEVDSDKGIAVLYARSDKDCSDILAETNFTLDGKEPTLSAAQLVWDLRDFSRDEDVSASRFEDNEELRYSLRSLERFAPWVRHVYIVTNGQLPYWLNLENPRITLVTHDEIFQNKSHLPSFSSPAIESNLHRIPGLSDKFIYMNDDVMFGKEVWPDDFYTHSSGQKVYLTWPVPNCNEGCPSSWIRDGYCDKACNVSECEWDAGDCDGSNPNVAAQAGGWAGSWGGDGGSNYCHSGCANNWIADRYCDTACNVLECGYDAGDCGTDKYTNMYGIMLDPDIHRYTLPSGLGYGYFNLTHLLPDKNTTLKDAFYDDNKIIRTIAVAKKFHVLTIVLYSNMSKTEINFTLEYGSDNRTKQLNLTLEVDTKPQATAVAAVKPVVGKNISMVSNKTVPMPTVETIEFHDIPDDQIGPVIMLPTKSPDLSVKYEGLPANLTSVAWPPHLKLQFDQLQQELQQEELTEIGYRLRVKLLWLDYQEFLKLPEAAQAKLIEQVQGFSKEVGNVEKRKTQGSNVRDIHDRRKGKSREAGVVKQAEENGHGIEKPSEDTPNFPVKDKISAKKRLENIIDVKSEEKQAKDPQALVNDEKSDEKKKNNDDEVVDDKDKVIKALDANAGGKRRKLLAWVNDSVVISASEEVELENNGMQRDPSEGVGDSFVEFVDIQPDTVRLLPWEKGALRDLQQRLEQQESMASYETNHVRGRVLLDTFGDSLRHVNTLYNKAFGYGARKVPGHMPHMIDRNIMTELQARFPAEWEATSSHQVRHSKDMQFAFSYFYYLMGVKENVTAAQVFDEMDTDKSRILSDREIRTLATRLYDLPLDLQTLTSLELMFVNCSKSLTSEQQTQPGISDLESYYEKQMPQVTRNLFINCHEVRKLVLAKFPPKNKYRHVEVDDSEIAFKMIKTNVSSVVGQLDDVRKNPKKFICLNDNIDHHRQDQARTVKAIIADFYESVFPLQSQFELPREYRNRFTHIDELREWRNYRDWLKFWTHLALVLLVVFTVASYFSDKIEAAQRRYLRRRSPSPDSSQSEQSCVDQGHGGAIETV